ncbi:MAG: hypothetical protein DCC49_10045 [Acidobacteria bacterium]|nr:MAG: hypothetical protein DCC49_10045 [Acidobacteriota bacterium]
MAPGTVNLPWGIAAGGTAITETELAFEEELLAFGVGLDELEAAFAILVREVWEGIDSAMEPLWSSDDERRQLAATCDIGSLLEAEPIESNGVCRLLLDVEAEVAAESVSRSVAAPLLAISRYGDDWTRITLFERGKSRAWLFWASSSWINGHENELEPALASAARASGGWLGEPADFELLLARGCSRSDLRRLLETGFDSAAEFADGFRRLVGAPELI